MLVLLSIFLIYLGIMFYIVKNKDTKLALYFIKLLILITLVKIIYIFFNILKKKSLCQIIMTGWNCN